jgi:hypothetical protein
MLPPNKLLLYETNLSDEPASSSQLISVSTSHPYLWCKHPALRLTELGHLRKALERLQHTQT